MTFLHALHLAGDFLKKDSKTYLCWHPWQPTASSTQSMFNTSVLQSSEEKDQDAQQSAPTHVLLYLPSHLITVSNQQVNLIIAFLLFKAVCAGTHCLCECMCVHAHTPGSSGGMHGPYDSFPANFFCLIPQCSLTCTSHKVSPCNVLFFPAFMFLQALS